jgi:hypothetical protein
MHRPGMVALLIGGFGLAVLAIVVSSLREAAAMNPWAVAEGPSVVGEGGDAAGAFASRLIRSRK